MLYLLTILLCGAFIVFVTRLNIWYWIRRQKLTPAERAQEDMDARIPGDW